MTEPTNSEKMTTCLNFLTSCAILYQQLVFSGLDKLRQFRCDAIRNCLDEDRISIHIHQLFEISSQIIHVPDTYECVVVVVFRFFFVWLLVAILDVRSTYRYVRTVAQQIAALGGGDSRSECHICVLDFSWIYFYTYIKLNIYLMKQIFTRDPGSCFGSLFAVAALLIISDPRPIVCFAFIMCASHRTDTVCGGDGSCWAVRATGRLWNHKYCIDWRSATRDL